MPRRRPYRSLAGIGVLSLLTLLAMAGVKSYHDLATVRRHEVKLQRKIGESEERIEALKKRVDLIQNDPLTLERLAREDLGMVRAGDVVILLPEEEPSPAESP